MATNYRRLLLALGAICLMCGVSYGATVTLSDGESAGIACVNGQDPSFGVDSALCEAVPVQHTLHVLGSGTQVDYSISVTGELTVDESMVEAGETETVSGGNSADGFVIGGDDGWFFTGDMTLEISSTDVGLQLDGEALDPADYLVEPEPEPEALSATARMLSEDDDVYSMGWSSAHYVQLPDGSDCLLMTMGHATAGDDNNSGRCIDPVAETKSYLWPDTEGDGTLDGGINDRDNHASLILPAADGSDAGILIFGGDSSSGGYFDFSTQTWTHRWFSESEYGDGLISNWVFDKPFNPFQDCSAALKKCVLYGGKETGASNQMIVIEPTPSGPLPYAAHEVVNSGSALRDGRDLAAIVGDYLYVYSGRDSSTNWTNDLYRTNVATEDGVWEQLASGPSAGGFSVMTYDPDLNALVVYGGDKSNRVLVYAIASNSWTDLTDTAGMPYVSLHAGDYYPPSGEHCYRGGIFYNSDGSQQNWSRSADVWCMKLTGEPGGGGGSGSTELSITTVAMPGAPDRSWNEAPSSDIKHTSWAWNPVTEEFISMAGDFSNSPAGEGSYRQDLWAYQPSTDTWRLASPYCVADGEVAPRHPDVPGWRWDAGRNVYWYAPGLMNPSSGENCSVGTYERWKVMSFDPATGKFTVPPQDTFPHKDTGIPLGSGAIRHSEYLPQEDMLFRIGSSKVAYFDIQAGTWDVHAYTKDDSVPSLANIKFAEPRLIGRDVYLDVKGELVRFNLDDETMYHVRSLPEGYSQQTQQYGDWLIMLPFQFDRPDITDIVAYNPVTDEMRTALLRDPAVMDDEYGMTFGVNPQGQLFYYGTHKGWNNWFTEFYLVDLSGWLQ